MALGKNEIRKANQEYYHTTYFTMLSRIKSGATAVAFVFIWQGMVYCMQQTFLKERYTKLAGTRDLQGTEVYDWVEMQVSSYKTSEMVFFIVMGAGLLFACIICSYSMKNYNLYKYKLIYNSIIFLIIIVEIAGIIYTIPEEIEDIQGNNGIYILYMIAQGIAFIFNEGIMLPVELKKPLKSVGKILGWITDKILKRL